MLASVIFLLVSFLLTGALAEEDYGIIKNSNSALKYTSKYSYNPYDPYNPYNVAYDPYNPQSGMYGRYNGYYNGYTYSYPYPYNQGVGSILYPTRFGYDTEIYNGNNYRNGVYYGRQMPNKFNHNNYYYPYPIIAASTEKNI